MFDNGYVIDFILGFMLVEIIVLILIRNKGLPRFHPIDLIVNGGAGAALLMALRAALGPVHAWQGIALWLLIALAFHLCDLTLRWSIRRTE